MSTLTSSLPLPALATLFAMAAAAVWMAGARLAYAADELSDRRKLSKSLVGLLLLSTATSLPEIATTLSAAARQAQALVLNNLYGGIALQTAILAVADFWARGAITNFPRLMTHALEASLLIVLLALSAAVIVLGEPVSLFGVGLGSLAIAVAYGGVIWFLRVHDPQRDWLPVELPGDADAEGAVFARAVSRAGDLSLLVQGVTCCAAIFVFGLALVVLAEALADRTGLGTGFVGVTLLAGATSLPELTTSIAAVRMGAYTLAISNIFGSNLIMLVLVFPADILFRQGPILAGVERVSLLAILSGLLVTGIYLGGLIVRRKPRIGRFGVDSVAVLAVFAASVIGYYLVS